MFNQKKEDPMDKLALGMSAISLIYLCVLLLVFNFHKLKKWLEIFRLIKIPVRKIAVVNEMRNHNTSMSGAPTRMAA